MICRALAVILLAAVAFYVGRHVGYESARPWELTDYGSLDPAQMSEVIEGIQERISDLQDRLARAIKAQREKLAAAGLYDQKRQKMIIYGVPRPICGQNVVKTAQSAANTA